MTMKDVSSVAYESFNGHGLADLPPEVLSEVASNLDFIDLVSFQQTSKKLRDSADVRFIWLALAKEYSARHFHLYRPETGSIDDFETDELRAWTRKRLIVDQIWRAPRIRPYFRTLDQGEDNLATFLRLVPGTRWLLVGYKDGSVCCYDLDSEDPEQIPLIPSLMLDEEIFKGIDALEVYIDQSASRLEFKLALDMERERDEDGFISTCGWLHVWQIKLEDGNFLVAEWLNSLAYGFGFNNALTLGPQVLVCTAALHVDISYWVDLYWWKQCSGIRLLRARFYAGKNELQQVRLIGNDRILCIDDGGIRLYDFPEPKHIEWDIDTDFEDAPKRGPIWSHSSLDLISTYLSPVCYDGTAYRFILSTQNGFWGFFIPENKDDNPSIIQLSNFASQPLTYCLGVCKAYTYLRGDGIRIGYSWDDEGGFPVINYPGGRQQGLSSFIPFSQFDETNGRFVYIDGGVTVVDIFR